MRIASIVFSALANAICLSANPTQHLDAVRFQRIATGALAGVGLLVLAVLAYVVWQDRDVTRREQVVFTSLASEAMKDEQFDRAMRFALQAYPARGAMPWAGARPSAPMASAW
jgi:hypothetical protein